jgi:prepilin-type N-terminal cleavage/methylation domain-containing protein
MSRLRDQHGFTIIEVMAATFIISIAFLGLASVHVTASKAHSLGLNQTTAAMVATQAIENLRRQEWVDIQGGDPAPTTIDGVTYSVGRGVTDVNLGRKLDVTVTWADRFGPHTLQTSTLISQVTNP